MFYAKQTKLKKMNIYMHMIKKSIIKYIKICLFDCSKTYKQIFISPSEFLLKICVQYIIFQDEKAQFTYIQH